MKCKVTAESQSASGKGRRGKNGEYKCGIQKNKNILEHKLQTAP